MLKIKSPDREEEFKSLAELRVALEDRYRERHVSIKYSSKPHGLMREIYVSVESDGAVVNTFGSKDFVEFKKIESELLK